MVTGVVEDDIRGFVILETEALFAQRFFPMQGGGCFGIAQRSGAIFHVPQLELLVVGVLDSRHGKNAGTQLPRELHCFDDGFVGTVGFGKYARHPIKPI